jgi:predicted phosphodiesterase
LDTEFRGDYLIFVTGDTHIPIDIHKLSTKNWPEQRNLTKSDYLIICGDFGGVWNNSNEDKYWQDWLLNKNFTTLFVDGNHENFNLLNNYPVSIFNGGKVHAINESIYHLMRGQIYKIDNKLLFTMGGASSHDKWHRREGISWWSEELPSFEEYEEALNNLNDYNYNIDVVITHCAPDSIVDLFGYSEHDKLTNFLDAVVKYRCNYDKWYFGHYHKDEIIDSKHMAIYNKIIEL